MTKIRRYNLYDVWFSITQGQGPVGCHEEIAVSKGFSVKQAKTKILNQLKLDGSVRIKDFSKQRVISVIL